MNKYRSIRFKTIGPAVLYFRHPFNVDTFGESFPDMTVELPADRIRPWCSYSNGQQIFMIFFGTSDMERYLTVTQESSESGMSKIAHSFAVGEEEYNRLLELHNLFEGNHRDFLEGNPQSFLVENNNEQP